MTAILHFDEQLFQLINGEWHNSFLDTLLPLWRNKLFWIPAYILGLAYLIWKYKKQAIFFVLAIVLTIGISDTLSSKIIKKTVKRPRPCRTEVLAEDLHLLVHCGGGYSFTSSHATNHFALAVFLISIFGTMKRKWKFAFLFWAGSIAYGQVYVGVHYPLDVFSGAILGSLVGYLVAILFNNWAKKIIII